MDFKAIFTHISLKQMEKWERKLEKWENSNGEIELRADLSALSKEDRDSLIEELSVIPNVEEKYDYIILWR